MNPRASHLYELVEHNISMDIIMDVNMKLYSFGKDFHTSGTYGHLLVFVVICASSVKVTFVRLDTNVGEDPAHQVTT